MDVLTRVALIANNPAITDIPEADVYYHFNSAIHWGKTPDLLSAIVVRMAHTVRTAHSFRCYPNAVKAGCVLSCGWQNEIQQFRERNPNHGAADHIYIDVPEYPEGKSPTTGWAVLQRMLLIKDVDITCVGFDLKSASYYKASKLHALDWEIEQFRILVESGRIKAHQSAVASVLTESLEVPSV